MRREELRLRDIVECADAIQCFLSGIERDSFAQDDLLQSAVLRKLTIIGEACAHLSLEFRQRHPETEWRDVVAFRNFAVHAYFSINSEIVWVAATQDAPLLRDRIARILESEYPATPPSEDAGED